MSVEIIGRAIRAPGANSPEELFDILRQRRCMITRIPGDRWDHARYWHPEAGTRGKTYTFAAGVIEDVFAFDAAVFGLSQREAGAMDPQQRLILDLAWRAFESANLDYTDLRHQRVGVYVGASSLDHGSLITEDIAAGSPYFMTGNTLSIVSNRISHVFGLNGPSLTVDTACSSSLVALDLAMKALESGEVDTALVGGVNVLSNPLAFVGFAQARMLSPQGLCRAYDNEAFGYVRAEGGAVVILRRSDNALAAGDRSFARILASGVNSAGHTNGISMPSSEAQAQLLRSLYQGQGIDPNRLAFIEGHGTGTKVGDPAEVWSIGTVIGSQRRAPIPIGSIKTNIGHTEPASGLFGLMKAMLALEHNFLPASLHFDTANDAIDFGALNVHVAADPIELLHGRQARLAGVNSFGFGGTNAHVVISDPPAAADKAKPEAGGRVFMASAHTASALDGLLESWRDGLREALPAERPSIISAAGANRPHLRHRFVAVGNDADAVTKAIETRSLGRNVKEAAQAEAVQDQAKLAFVFSGNGSQWAGMAVDAYRTDTAFRDRFSVIHALFQVRSQISLIDLLTDPELEEKLSDTKVAQPLLFAIQAALADVLAQQGVKPDAVYGHSVGEVAAAYVSGAISLVDAVSVVAKRSYHQDSLAGLGGMAAVQLSPDDARGLFARHGMGDITVAAINAAGSVTVSGPVEQIAALRGVLAAERIAGQVLDIDYPFHHKLIDEAEKAFLDDMAQIALRPSQVPFISTVSGAVMPGTSLDSTYWWRNVREPVQFLQATDTAIDLGCTLFVEIGPRPILTSYLRDTFRSRAVAARAIPSLLREEHPANPVATAFARILANGGAFDRRRAFGMRNASVTLPPLPFASVNTRHEFTSEAVDIFGRQGWPYTLAGWRIDPASGSWRNHLDAHLFPDLAEHVVDGKSILPGSAFLDVALSTAKQFLRSEQVEISNLEILRPLELAADHLRELWTTISEDTGDLEIRSRERLSGDDWTLHVIARARKVAAGPPARPAPGEHPAGAPIAGADAYETARNFGLYYGPTFRLLHEAARIGENRIEAMINRPAATRNPYLTYTLHPVSVDAAFHGLIAVLAEASSQSRGAPFIPVRFGCSRLYDGAATIRRAFIDIRRMSAGSIQADCCFVDDTGQVVATFEDCRFKRTFLHQQKSLGDVSYHQALVPGRVLIPGKVLIPEDIRSEPKNAAFFRPPSEGPDDGSTRMIEAAVCRASYEIARKASRNTGLIVADRLPGDAAFRSFLANCLYLLEDIGLATLQDEQWKIEAECALPSVSSILNVVYRDRPDRIAEIVAVNDVYLEAMNRFDALRAPSRGQAEPQPAGTVNVVTGKTVESLGAHAPASVARIGMATEALRAAIQARPQSTPVRRIVEIGIVSLSVSAEFARLAAEAGAAYVALEPREAERAELTNAFEAAPLVTVVKPTDIGQIGAVDIIISAAEDVFTLLRNESLLGAVAPLFGASTRVLLCAAAPSAFADFAFGLADGWFDRGKGAEFPVGRLASPEDWRSLLDLLPVHDVSIVRHALVHGPVISVEAWGSGTAEPEIHPRTRQTGLVVLRGDADFKPAQVADLTIVRLNGDAGADREALAAALPGDAAVDVIYIPDPVFGDGSEWLNANMTRLATIARLLGTHQAGDVEGEGARKRLALLLPHGDAAEGEAALHSSAGLAGLWAFMRVLRNEFEDIEGHALDFSAAPFRDLPAQLERALNFLHAGSDNREWAIDPATGDALEMRIVPRPIGESQASTRDFAAASVRQRVSSQVSSLTWQSDAPGVPEPDEVLIEVAATGLNFRDVMWAMGMLPEEALEDGFAGPTIGMECAGTILSVGSQVDNFAVGDKVMAVAPAAFSTHVRVKRSGVARLPEGIDALAGATLPVAFLTAYYAIIELARIQPDETILIHGGAGGVGLAALQVAKARGARVIATAGSTEKRRLLETLGADHVFNSRSLSFVEEVLAVTDHAGVDVVLNSLYSEAMERSLSLLKPFGRFLELGKRDFYADTKIGLRPFRRNISYFGIDADQLLNAEPKKSARLLAELSEMFAKGDLTPLPYRAFRHDEIVGAFRLMQGSGHIGKIVVKAPVSGKDHVLVAPRSRMRLGADGVHLVVGGVGGFGLAAAQWLVERGARRLALCSRRGVADEDARQAIARWSARGVTTSLHVCDVTDEAAVSAMLSDIRASAPLKTVIHAAMVLDDGLIENLTDERIAAVIAPKVKGAAILDRLTRQDRLDDFILFSSATTLVGNPGQANYVAANGYLEGLARARRAIGLPALAVGFGAISDTGFIARNKEVSELLSKRLGRTGMTAGRALAYVEDYLSRDPGTVDAAVVAIAEIDMNMARHLRTVAAPLFEVVARSAKANSLGSDGDKIDLAALVEGKSREEGEQIIFQLVATEIAAILRVPASEVSPLKVIRDIGLDSLMAMELGMSFRQKTGFEIPLSSVTQSTTVGDVARKLYLKISQHTDTGAAPEKTADVAVVDRLANRHTTPVKAGMQ